MRFFETRSLLLPRDGVNVQWGVEPEDTDLTTIEVELARSESPAGPFTKLQVFDPFTTFSFTDKTAPWRPKNFDLYYRLQGVTASTGSVVTSPRHQVDVVVSEYGAAELAGRTVGERARALAEIAHPDVREELRAAAREIGGRGVLVRGTIGDETSSG